MPSGRTRGAKPDAAACRIVTWLKTDTPLTPHSERLVDPGGLILSDRTGYLPARQARTRKNPMSGRAREVRVRIETGKVLRIVGNDPTRPAQTIADLHK